MNLKMRDDVINFLNSYDITSEVIADPVLFATALGFRVYLARFKQKGEYVCAVFEDAKTVHDIPKIFDSIKSIIFNYVSPETEKDILMHEIAYYINEKLYVTDNPNYVHTSQSDHQDSLGEFQVHEILYNLAICGINKKRRK